MIAEELGLNSPIPFLMCERERERERERDYQHPKKIKNSTSGKELPKPSFLCALAFSLCMYGILSTCTTYLSWCNSGPGQQYSLANC